MISSILITGIPISFKYNSVPPVEKILIPNEFSFLAIVSIPFLSKTDINADFIFNIFIRWLTKRKSSYFGKKIRFLFYFKNFSEIISLIFFKKFKSIFVN